MTRRPPADIQVAGIIGFEPPEHFRRGVCMGRHGDQMEMIGHKAVAPKCQPVLSRVAGKKVEKDGAVMIGVEYIGAPISTLGEVVRHAKEVSLGSAKSQKLEEGVVVPDFRRR